MYTDAEMLAFSDIAYKDLSKYDMCVADHYRFPDGKVPLRYIMEPQDIAQIANQYGIDVDTISDWKIVSSPANCSSGMSACIIETDPGQATMAFRGSENLADPIAVLTDWIEGNAMLGYGETTPQQEDINQYLAENKELLQQYDSLALTGHSLGGNCAEYATIISSEYGLDKKIKQCVNNDGPGFTNEWTDEHKEQIQQMQGVITHYQWSLVGTIFRSDIGTVHYVNSNGGEIGKHFLENVMIDKETGKLIRTDSIPGITDDVTGDFTQWLDSRYIGMQKFSTDILVVLFGGWAAIKAGVDYVTGNNKPSASELLEIQKAHEQANKQAHCEVATNLSFTINPESFISLSDELNRFMINIAANIGNRMQTIIAYSQSTSTVANPTGSSAITSLNQQITEVNKKIKSLQSTAEQCKSDMDKIIATLTGCQDYLYQTGTAFVEIEKEAKSRVAQWIQ